MHFFSGGKIALHSMWASAAAAAAAGFIVARQKFCFKKEHFWPPPLSCLTNQMIPGKPSTLKNFCKKTKSVFPPRQCNLFLACPFKREFLPKQSMEATVYQAPKSQRGGVHYIRCQFFRGEDVILLHKGFCPEGVYPLLAPLRILWSNPNRHIP